jgi:UDPglucose 6-dehydrogenase
MNITVIGAGYVGLVSAACFAEFGFAVTCVDKEEGKISALKAGKIPIYEPGLDQIVQSNYEAGRLKFSTELAPAVADANVVFIAVGTPTRRGEDAADLSFVFGAGEEIAKAMDGFTVVVTKSTVPVGTASKLKALIRESRPDADFEVASNPEFLREGSAVEDFLRPDRIVVGVSSERAEAPLRQLYRPLTQKDVPIVFTSCQAAEVIKYAANTYLATRIGFVNQLADLCEKVDADIVDVTRGMGLDKRIGQHYLHPGPGFGGSCFPKDTRALMVTAREHGAPFSIVEEVIDANDRRKRALAERVCNALGGSAEGKRVAVLGIAFKADTDDIRDAASLVLIPELQKLGATISAYDPAAMDNGRSQFDHVQWCADAYSAAIEADIVVILTEWNEFRGLDIAKLVQTMRSPVMVDFRNLFSLEDVSGSGLVYHSLGRTADTMDNEDDKIVLVRSQ